MRRRSGKLPDEYYETNRRIKRQLIEADIPRPKARLVKFCFAMAMICAAVELIAIWRGDRLTTAISFTMAAGATMLAIVVQMWPVIAEAVRKWFK